MEYLHVLGTTLSANQGANILHVQKISDEWNLNITCLRSYINVGKYVIFFYII